MRGGIARIGLGLAVAALVLLSGCIGSDEGPGEDIEPQVAEAADDTTNATANDAANATEPVVEYVEEVRAFEWTGYIGPRATVCVYAGVDLCHTETPSLRGWEVWYEIPTDHAPVSGWFKLTWDDAVDAREMNFGLFDEPCDGSCSPFAWATGPSGITVSFEDSDIAPGDLFAVLIWHPSNRAGEVRFQGGGPMEFTVTGEYTVLVPSG